LIQIGGFGIVGFASLVGYLLEGRISLKNKMNASSESSLAVAPDIKTLLKNIAKLMLGFQAVLFVFLFVRFFSHYQYDWHEALGHGLFHAIAAFNNAGFALYSDNLMSFARDGWIMIPIFFTVLLASFGFPVLVEIRDRLKLKLFSLLRKKADYWMKDQWSLNSRIILWSSFVLIIVGTLGIAVFEWSNPKTLGAFDATGKVLAATFASLMPRTAGFNALDISAMLPSTWLGTDLLMFIGGGSASTSGGIKLGTAVILFYIIYTEIRGEAAVNIGNRRLPRSMQRQALTIVSLTTCGSSSITYCSLFNLLSQHTFSGSVLGCFNHLGLGTTFFLGTIMGSSSTSSTTSTGTGKGTNSFFLRVFLTFGGSG
jgi:Trk-type K+ transport system membrane component